MRTVIGIDYDSHAVHLGILGKKLSVIRQTVYESLLDTMLNLWELLDNLSPTLVIVEAPVYIQNPKTSFKLARVHTLICMACEAAKVHFEVLENTRWKKLTLGSARKNKQEVFEAMRERFGEVISDSHFADAAAMALAGRKLLEEAK